MTDKYEAYTDAEIDAFIRDPHLTLNGPTDAARLRMTFGDDDLGLEQALDALQAGDSAEAERILERVAPLERAIYAAALERLDGETADARRRRLAGTTLS